MTYEVDSASMSPARDMERWAENQRPKTRNFAELSLQRYDGTDLYQWWGKLKGSVFWDAQGAPFTMRQVGG